MAGGKQVVVVSRPREGRRAVRCSAIAALVVAGLLAQAPSLGVPAPPRRGSSTIAACPAVACRPSSSGDSRVAASASGSTAPPPAPAPRDPQVSSPDMVAVLDSARASEGLPPIAETDAEVIAADPASMVISLINGERSARGLPAGQLTGADAAAVADAAEDGTDPTGPAGVAWRGLWGRSNAPDAAAQMVYEFVYDDGWNGSVAATPNVDCTGPGAPGCDAHRDAVLMANPPGTTLQIEAGEATISVAGSDQTSVAVLMTWVPDPAPAATPPPPPAPPATTPTAATTTTEPPASAPPASAPPAPTPVTTVPAPAPAPGPAAVPSPAPASGPPAFRLHLVSRWWPWTASPSRPGRDGSGRTATAPPDGGVVLDVLRGVELGL